MHAVDGDFTRGRGNLPFHKANLIHVGPVFKYAEGVAVIKLPFAVKYFIQPYPQLLYIFPGIQIKFVFRGKVSVFDIVFFKAFIVGGNHAVVCHKVAGNLADTKQQKKEDNKIFSYIFLKFPKISFL